MDFFRRRKIFKKLNYLDATPIRKSDYKIDKNGIVTIIVPKFKSDIIAKIFFHQRKRFFRIALDEIGSVVWQQIDGQNNVDVICKKSEEVLGEKIHPVEQRVTKFLTMLYNARYISFKEIAK